MSWEPPPLWFEVPALRCSDDSQSREHQRVYGDDRKTLVFLLRHGADESAVLDAREREIRYELWNLVTDALELRRFDRNVARIVLVMARAAWEGHCRGDFADSSQYVLAGLAASQTAFAALWRERDDKARRRQAERARKPRKDVSNEEIAAHRTRYIEERGGSYGWVKRAVIDFHGRISERALRERCKKMRQ